MKHFKIIYKMMLLVFGGRLIADLFRFIRDFFINVGQSAEESKASADAKAPSFDEAADKLKYKESDLKDRSFQLQVEFWLFFSILMVAILFLGANINHGGMSIVGSCAVILFSFTRVMISSYRYWNIKTRTIHTFKQWLHTPSVWVPTS